MVGDRRVKSNMVAGGAAEIVAEKSEAGVELLEDDSLGLDLANLLGDDPLGHLREDEEALLDDFNGFTVADEFLICLNNSLGLDFANEVLASVEIIKAGERRESTPVIEGDVTTGSEPVDTMRSGDDTCDQSRSDDGGLEELSEHFYERVLVKVGKKGFKLLKRGYKLKKRLSVWKKKATWPGD